MEAVIIFLSLFGAIFGIIYLYFSTRNKERMALIEKGADASIFFSKKEKKAAPIWKILILNLSLLLMGIGAGIFFFIMIEEGLGIRNHAIAPACIFLTAGIGLFVGFKLTQSLDKQ